MERSVSVEEFLGSLLRLNKNSNSTNAMGGLGQRTDSEAAFQEFLKRIPSATALSQHQEDGKAGGMLASASTASLFGIGKEDPAGSMPRVESLDALRPFVDMHDRDSAKLPSMDLQQTGAALPGSLGLPAGVPSSAANQAGGSRYGATRAGSHLIGASSSPTQLFRPSGVVRGSSGHAPDGVSGGDLNGNHHSSPQGPAMAGSPQIGGARGMAYSTGPAGAATMGDIAMHTPAASLLYQGGVPTQQHVARVAAPGQMVQSATPPARGSSGPGALAPSHLPKPQSAAVATAQSAAMAEQDKQEQRRARRMLSNRESARRSRKRKQEQLQELETQIQALEQKNEHLEQQCQAAALHVQKLMTDKQRLENENQHLMSIFHQLQKSLGKEKIRLHLPAALGGSGAAPTDMAALDDGQPDAVGGGDGDGGTLKRPASVDVLQGKLSKRAASAALAASAEDKHNDAHGSAGTSKTVEAT